MPFNPFAARNLQFANRVVMAPITRSRARAVSACRGCSEYLCRSSVPFVHVGSVLWVSMARQDAAVAETKFEAQLARAQEAQERKDHAREQLAHP